MRSRRLGLALATLLVAALTIEVFAGQPTPLRLPLSDVPFQLGGWSGRVEAIDPEFVRRARPDEFLHRRYADADGRSVVVYVGYYQRRAAQGQVQAVCPGECSILSARQEAIDLQGARAGVNRAVVRQDGTEMAVLYWYQQGGRVSHDPYREKVLQTTRALLHRRSEGALVRISAAMLGAEDEAWRRAVAFARALFPVLRQHFPD